MQTTHSDSRPMRWWMIRAARDGDGWLWSGIGSAVLLFGGERSVLAVADAAIAAFCGWIFFRELRILCDRPRLAERPWSAIFRADRFSFPSGQTITAFAVAVCLSHFYPGLAIGLLLCAAVVAASRVLLGMHFISDVLSGAAVGAIVAWEVTAMWA